MSESKWCCTFCTYQNWPAATACVLCRNERSGEVVAESGEKVTNTDEKDIYKLAVDDKESPSEFTCESSESRSANGNENSELIDVQKWSCAACTYLNWPKSLHCVQCRTPKPPEHKSTEIDQKKPDSDAAVLCSSSELRLDSNAVSEPVSSPNEKSTVDRATEIDGKTEVAKDENSLKTSESENELLSKAAPETRLPSKWNCRVCTFENCVRSSRCVICGSVRQSKGLKSNNPSQAQSTSSNECDSSAAVAVAAAAAVGTGSAASSSANSNTSSRNNSRAQSPITAHPQTSAIPATGKKEERERDSTEKDRQTVTTGNAERAKSTDIEQHHTAESQAQRGSITVRTTRQTRRNAERTRGHAVNAIEHSATAAAASWTGVGALAKAGCPRSRAMRRLPCTALGAGEHLSELNRLLLACVGVRNTVSVNIVRPPRGAAGRGRAAAGLGAQVGLSGSGEYYELPFPCYYVGLECSFTLPQAVYAMPFTLQNELLSAVVDGEALAALEADAAVNWSIELVDRLQSRFYALANRTSGDCLLDSALQAICGVCDRDSILRRLLCESLVSCSELFFAAWKRYELERQRHAGLIYTLSDAQWRADWRELLELAGKPGSSLEQLHVFALAHILRRPIIVYSVRFVTGLRGDPLAASPFQGVYLPIFWERAFCSRSPIALGYTRCHFSALVPIEPSSVCPSPSASTSVYNPTWPRDELHSPASAAAPSAACVYYPLVDSDGALLPIPFTTPSMMVEPPSAADLDDGGAASGVSANADVATLCEWLDCVETPSGLLVARCRLQPRLAPVRDICQNWLDSFRRPADSRAAPVDIAEMAYDSGPRVRKGSRPATSTSSSCNTPTNSCMPRRKPSPVDEHSDACATRGRSDEDTE